MSSVYVYIRSAELAAPAFVYDYHTVLFHLWIKGVCWFHRRRIEQVRTLRHDTLLTDSNDLNYTNFIVFAETLYCNCSAIFFKLDADINWDMVISDEVPDMMVIKTSTPL